MSRARRVLKKTIPNSPYISNVRMYKIPVLSLLVPPADSSKDFKALVAVF